MNLDTLRAGWPGELLTPASPRYDGARRLWNGMIDARPAAIARCTSADDVAAVVRFAASEGLYPAIRAGGHNVAGLGTVDDGLVIDLSQMKRITVNPAARTATCDPGLTWGEFDAATQAFGLATTGGVNATTGIAGLTLGGGVGWLMGRCGLTCDNTIAYTLVTAHGDRMRACPDEHPDLFWALNGGGGNFGVVTSFTYRLHELRAVISGMIIHPFARAHDALRHYRDFVMHGIPDELTVFAAALTGPDGDPLLAVIPSWSGADLDEGERVLAPLRAFGPPLADRVERMSYVSMQQIFSAGAPFGIRSYWQSSFLRALPDDAIDAFVDVAAARVSPKTVIKLEHMHGAATRVAADATAFPARHDPFNLVVLSLWDKPSGDASNIAWTRAFARAMVPWSARQVYVNALGADEGARVRDAYGENYARLASVKAMYDPGNRFRRNHNIAPAE